MNYKQRIAPGIECMSHALLTLEEKDADQITIDYLWHAQRLLLNPFQTTPKERYIQITISHCNEYGDCQNSQTETIEFNREISAAMLYSLLKEHTQYYDPIVSTMQATLQDIENWLNQQKGLMKYDCYIEHDLTIIEDTGFTIAEFKTSYGSIDFFIEYGVRYPHED